MPATRWTKFYWSNWLGHINLRLCSVAARGFWMDVLCIAADNDPVGYVEETGPAFTEMMCRVSGLRKKQVEKYTKELEKRGVFQRDRRGRIFCPRMVHDNKKLQEAIASGRRGGRASRDNQKGIFADAEAASSPASNDASELEPKKQETQRNSETRC